MVKGKGWAMFSIERRGREWLVMQADEMVSVHPSREEAERAVEWLANTHTHVSSPDRLVDSDADPESCDR